MNLKLMMTNDSADTLNKSKLTVSIESINLTPNQSVLAPIISLQTDTDLSNINYAEIPELNRFYFIINKEVIGYKVYRLFLKVDVIESYKKEILESHSILYLNSVLPETKIVESDFEPQETSYILATIGERVE